MFRLNIWPSSLRHRRYSCQIFIEFTQLCDICSVTNITARKIMFKLFMFSIHLYCRSQWPRCLKRRSAAARLLRLWVRIPPEAWMFVCCECCVLSGRGLCDELITRLEESYRPWSVVVCDLETSWMRRPWPTGGCYVKKKKTNKQNSYILVMDILTHISFRCRVILDIRLALYHVKCRAHFTDMFTLLIRCCWTFINMLTVFIRYCWTFH